MASDLLKRTLINELQLELIFKWLTFKDITENVHFNCSQGEFVSYFLNFVHNEIAHLNTTQTPKSQVELKSNKKETATVCEVSSTPNKTSIDKTPDKTSIDKSSNKTSIDNTPSNMSIDKTPISNKMQDVFNSSICVSPISPLYDNNHSFTTPKYKNCDTSGGAWTPKHEKTLCLGDFLIQRKSSNKKKNVDVANTSEGSNKINNRRTRRINPTNVIERKCSINFKKNENSFTFKDQVEEEETFQEQRLALVDEKKRIDFKNTNVHKIKTQLFQTNDEITPDKTKITFKSKLDVAVSIYKFIFYNNLLINVTSEVYFLMSLLLKMNFTGSDVMIIHENSEHFEPRYIFQSVHNILYFISNVLGNIKLILNNFDALTLKHLYENSNFKLFYNDNVDVDFILNKSEMIVNENVVESNYENVNFDTDTDNRENFPSDLSFQAFRKQRDLFYEILRIWEQNHLIPNWNYGLALSGKIKTLLNLYIDSDNFRHMAKLFKGQLLGTCHHKVVQGNEIISNDELSFLSKIPNVNADKLNRLKSRLLTKQTSHGINPIPHFPGYQEFYKDFITNCMNFTFITHIKDVFIYEIIQLNNNCVLINDYDEFDVDDATKEKLLNSLKNLKVLAKFLGYIDSLPYKTNTDVCEKTLESSLQLRNFTEPNLKLKLLLNEAIENGTLIVTIPWIVTYLAMLDYVNLRLVYYKDLYKLLFKIYLESKWYENLKLTKNKALVVLSLGWLFELPQFPTELYFDWFSKYKPQTIQNKKKLCLDNLNVVDQRILYNCCPYLEEIKKLLLSTNSFNNGITVKHITPLSTTVTSSEEMEDHKLKIKLEEAFLNSQPVSTRKTVDFISERVASACIKYICNTIVPDYKQNALKEFKKILEDSDKNDPNFNASAIISAKSTKCLSELLTLCRNETKTIREEKISKSIDSLLAIEELKQSKDLCNVIANKICNERIEQWILSHMSKDIFSKIFDNLMQKFDMTPTSDGKEKPNFLLPTVGKNIPHNPDCLSAVKCVNLIRSCIWDVIKKTDVSWETVQFILKTVENSINERCDLNDVILNVIHKLLLELVLLFLTHNYETMLRITPTTFILIFVEFWTDYLDNKDIFNGLLCPRNVLLLAQSTDIKKSWSLFAILIGILLEKSLLTYANFEEQCVTIFKQNWDKATLDHISNCLKEVARYSFKNGSNHDKFSFLLNFLSDYCWDLL